MPTSNSGGIGMRLVLFRSSLSTPGAILQPQPPPCEREVRRGTGAAVFCAFIESSPTDRSQYRWPVAAACEQRKRRRFDEEVDDARTAEAAILRAARTTSATHIRHRLQASSEI